MIVTNKTNGCIGFPMKGLTEIVNLVPGTQDVPDNKYALIKDTAGRWAKAGHIAEEYTKVDKVILEKNNYPKELVTECEEGKDKDKFIVPAKISDIDRRSGEKLNELIKGCFHIPTLEKWLKEEIRSDIRAEILNQKALVEEGDIKD